MPLNDKLRVISFAGAPFDHSPWTNRQQIMSRVAKTHPVLYIEARVWIFRFLSRNWRQPRNIILFLRKVLWYEKKHEYLYIKAQWNLIPGSREYKVITLFNHLLNRWSVLLTAWLLGFYSPFLKNQEKQLLIWIYDTEAAEYLSAFPKARILYDCVDDHRAQFGVDRNPERVRAEEDQILKRADLVTVTSESLFKLKKHRNSNTHLVLNAGDVNLYTQQLLSEAREKAEKLLGNIPHPILGSVGSLDSYKVDFEMLYQIAKQHPEWHFVLIGSPVVEQQNKNLQRLATLNNVHAVGYITQKDAPAYVAYFDVFLIPYRNSLYNTSSFPLKFWEFMATGKPIIVSGLPELHKYQPLINYAYNAGQFIEYIQSALKDPHVYEDKRIALAKQHTLEKRYQKILELVSTLFLLNIFIFLSLEHVH